MPRKSKIQVSKTRVRHHVHRLAEYAADDIDRSANTSPKHGKRGSDQWIGAPPSCRLRRSQYGLAPRRSTLHSRSVWRHEAPCLAFRPEPLILLIIGFPIFLILLMTSIIAVLTVADVPTEAIQTYMFGSLDNFPLLAVPFFVLAGEIIAQGGIARRIISMVMAIVGGVPSR